MSDADRARAEAINEYPDPGLYATLQTVEWTVVERERDAFSKGFLFAVEQDPTKIEINRELNQPTTCRVWQDGVLIFSGQDYSAHVRVEQVSTEAADLAERVEPILSLLHHRGLVNSESNRRDVKEALDVVRALLAAAKVRADR